MQGGGGMERRSVAQLAGTRVMVSVPAKRKISNHYTLYKPIFAKEFCKEDQVDLRGSATFSYLSTCYCLLLASINHGDAKRSQQCTNC